MTDVIKLIRYNTGTDKKLFAEFASNFDAVILNSTIAAYSGSAMADLVSIYMDRYIIDPQTHILQQNYDILCAGSRKGEIKKSILKYLEQLPNIFLNEIQDGRTITPTLVTNSLDSLIQRVGDFQLNYITSFIEKKEYNKYLEFISEEEGDGKVGDPKPKMLVAPYFMIKDSYSEQEIKCWLALNRKAIEGFIVKFKAQGFPIAAQLVLEKGVLEDIADRKTGMLDSIINTYQGLKMDFIFIWIDDFSALEDDFKYSMPFSLLLKELNKLHIKPIMSYGGYDSILLCHSDAPVRLYGVAQSVGYGEQRQITPVGGGIPVNKYYFQPTHQRLKLEDISSILYKKGYFDKTKTKKDRAKMFYEEICDCPQCRKVIGDDIDNFFRYNESKPFIMNNGISRNRATQLALEISARHFLHCKVAEWQSIFKEPFNDLINNYSLNIYTYGPLYDRQLLERFLAWKENYAR